MKLWIGRVLLWFAIFTLGFGLGREAGLKRGATNGTAAPASTVGGTNTVLVLYLHATFRCVTCNRIEELARQVVEDEFGEEHAAGRVQWSTANFQEREDLAARYGIASSTVVVVNVENGVEKGFKRLDDVWALHENPEAFAAYVGKAVRGFLKEAP